MTEDRTRQGRIETETSERRRRSDDNLDAGQALRMRIPGDVEAKLKAQGRTARWINVEVDQKTGQDTGSRMHDLTVRDDWDKVEGVEPRTVKIDKNGATAKAYLVSKRNDFIEEDRAKKDALRRTKEEAMLTGVDPTTGQSNLAPDQYAD